jgi:hypothetical protein
MVFPAFVFGKGEKEADMNSVSLAFGTVPKKADGIKKK